jgi:Transposase DDE domain
VNAKGLEELVADKGYHSGDVLVDLQGLEVRTYIAEPVRERRKWAGKRAEQAAVYGNRQRIGSHRGRQLLRRRGELVERTFAHAYETGALRRLYVRGKGNVQKRLLLQAAACNLALLLRKMVGVGTPRAMQDAVAHLLLVLLQCISATDVVNKPARSLPAVISRRMPHRRRCAHRNPAGKKVGFRHGLLARVRPNSIPHRGIPGLGFLHPEEQAIGSLATHPEADSDPC